MKKYTRLTFGLVLPVVIIYSLSWYYFSRQFEKHVEQQMAQIQAKGFDVSFDTLKVSGFPFGYDVNVEKLEVRRDGVFKSWVDGGITFSSRLWNPYTVTSLAGGTHHIVFDNIKAEGKGFRINTLKFDPMKFHFSYDDLRVFINDEETLEAKKIDYDLTFDNSDKAKSAILKLALHDVEVPALKEVIFGDTINELIIQAKLQGDLDGETLNQRLKNWYASEGTIDLSKLNLKWGEVTMTAEGTFSVDEDLQPIAAFTASVQGLDNLIDSLVKTGRIDQTTAEMIKFGAGFLGGEDSKLSFSIQDQKLMIGTVPLSEIPRINWQ